LETSIGGTLLRGRINVGKLLIGRGLLLGRRHLSCYQADIDLGEIAIPINLAWRWWSAWDEIRIGWQFSPLGDSETNVLALIDLQSAISENYRARATRYLAKDVYLIIASSKWNSPRLVTNLDFG
jgi:hypothetical protein